jgi:hypothetical protein
MPSWLLASLLVLRLLNNTATLSILLIITITILLAKY